MALLDGRRLLLAVLGLASSLAGPIALAQPRVDVGAPVPPWVDGVEVPASTDSTESLELLLVDRQLQVSADATARYVHIAYRSHDVDGVHEGSNLQMHVGADESLALHFVRRTRGSETATLPLAPEDVRLLHREERLEQGLIDERRMAVLVLEDVRVGDVIEYAFTVRTPPRAWSYSSIDRVHAGGPLRRLHWSARWAGSTPLRHRLVNVPADWVVDDRPGRLVLDARDVATREELLDAPDWYDPDPTVELTAFPGWAELAQWAAEVYERAGAGPLPPSVPMSHIRAGSTLEERILRALRYVQDDLRYLGLEIGEGAFAPSPPSVVAERGYGDCKDKALLLVRVLRELGLRAAPALVHSTQGLALEARLPSITAFDHVIVRFELDGAVHWVDATRSESRGTLATMAPVPFRRALVAGRGVRELEVIPLPVPERPSVEVTERWNLNGAFAVLALELVYRGDDADAMRPDAERIDSTALLTELGYHARRQGAAELSDDAERNELRIVQRFHVQDFWDGGTRDVAPWSVLRRLPERVATERVAAPLRVTYPLDVAHRMIFESFRGWDARAATETHRAGPLRLERTERVEDSELEVAFRLTSDADHVAAEEVDTFRPQLEELADQTGYQVVEYAEPAAGTSATDEARGSTFAFCCGGPLLLIVLAGAFVGARAYRRGRRRRVFLRRQRVSRGEAPERPCEVQDREEAERIVGSPRCCDQPVASLDWSTARLGSSPLLIAAWTCSRCGERTRRFFRVSRS